MSTLERFARHQAAAVAASIVDFGTMISLVTLGLATPAWATLVGASLGATTNFTVNRRWTFRATGSVVDQGYRYALVSAASAALNALGEHVATTTFRAPYVVARLVIALMVGALWNLPAQRMFVFRPTRSATP